MKRKKLAVELPITGVMNNRMSCCLRGITCSRHDVVFYFPEGDCCDMNGAVEVATAVHPKCKRIITISGDKLDTVYGLEKGGWRTTRIGTSY